MSRNAVNFFFNNIIILTLKRPNKLKVILTKNYCLEIKNKKINNIIVLALKKSEKVCFF